VLATNDLTAEILPLIARRIRRLLFVGIRMDGPSEPSPLMGPFMGPLMGEGWEGVTQRFVPFLRKHPGVEAVGGFENPRNQRLGDLSTLSARSSACSLSTTLVAAASPS